MSVSKTIGQNIPFTLQMVSSDAHKACMRIKVCVSCCFENIYIEHKDGWKYVNTKKHD